MAATARTATTPQVVPARPYPTPVLVAAGAVDLAAEQVRKMPTYAESARADVVAWIEGARKDASTRLSIVRGRTEALPSELGQVEELPAKAKAAVDKAVGELEEQYVLLAERGEALIAKIRGNQATETLQAQVKATEAKAKAARTTVEKSVASTRKATKAAATSATHTARAAEAAVEAAIESVGA